MKSFLRILRYTYKYWVFVVLNTIFNILSNVLSVFSIAMIFPILTFLFGTIKPVTEKPTGSLSITWILSTFNYEFSQIIQVKGRESALVFLCIAIVMVFFIKNL